MCLLQVLAFAKTKELEMANVKRQNPIKRRNFLKQMSAAAGIVVASPWLSGKSLSAQDTPAKKPNIIFIITDDQQRNMFNFREEGKGKNLSPNIDRLASEGTILRGQHCSSPVCTPSRFSCLTGQYASRAQNIWFKQITEKEGQSVVQWNTKIISSTPNVAKFLKQAGYATGMVGKNHVVHVPGWKRLPAKSDPEDPAVIEQLKVNADLIREELKKNGFDYGEAIYHNNPDWIGPRKLAVHNLDWVTKAGLDFIDQNKDRPFFLYFATTVPHGPANKARSWGADRRYTAEGILPEPVNLLSSAEQLTKRLKDAGLAGKAWGRENVLWLDDAVGTLIKKLEEHGIDDNTIIFYFNDHGMHAKGTVYQGGTETTCFLWKKGRFKAGAGVDALVSNIDFAPTMLDLAGVDYQPEIFDGTSLLPLFNKEADKVHDSLYFEMGYSRGIRKGDWKYVAVRYPDYVYELTLEQREQLLKKHNKMMRSRGKTIHNTDASKPFSHLSIIPGGGGAEYHSIKRYPAYFDNDQLYDLGNDPGEQVNLANNPDYTDTLIIMKQELAKHLEKLPGNFGDFKDE